MVEGHRIDVREGVTEITLQRGKVNALDLASIEFVTKAFSSIDPDTPVMITGHGSAFCAGVDTAYFGALGAPGRRAFILAISRMVHAICSFPGPVVAAVNGHALGGGFVLMLCADFRIATRSEAARFGMPEAKAGIPFPIGPVEVIRHELPPPLLRHMAMSSAIVPGEALFARDVIDALVPEEDVLASARKAAQELAAQPAFGPVKRQVRGDLITALEAHVRSGEDPNMQVFLLGAV